MIQEIEIKKFVEAWKSYKQDPANADSYIDELFDVWYLDDQQFNTELVFNCGCDVICAADFYNKVEYLSRNTGCNLTLVALYILAWENFNYSYGSIIFTTIQSQKKEIKLLQDIYAEIGGYTSIELYKNPKHPENTSTMWIFGAREALKYMYSIGIRF